MISERISDNIALQMKLLNMVIPILMHFCSFVSNWSVTSCIKDKAARHPTKCDQINDVKLFLTDSRIILWKILTLSNQMSHYKSCAL